TLWAGTFGCLPNFVVPTPQIVATSLIVRTCTNWLGLLAELDYRISKGVSPVEDHPVSGQWRKFHIKVHVGKNSWAVVHVYVCQASGGWSFWYRDVKHCGTEHCSSRSKFAGLNLAGLSTGTDRRHVGAGQSAGTAPTSKQQVPLAFLHKLGPWIRRHGTALGKPSTLHRNTLPTGW
ncbi:uncharacterized protein METZ01_LOCUS478807, partial [marine metagenome]